jgi:kynurenine formamidase
MARTDQHTAPGNWGRWGDQDERGTLNLVTPDAVLAATQVCRTGKVYSHSLPIQQQGMPTFDYRGQPRRLSLTSYADAGIYHAIGAPDGRGSNEDMLVLASHSITHMDALSHVFDEHKMYNGYGAESFTTAAGAQKLDITKTATFAGRGVLLDLPGHFGLDWLDPDTLVDADMLEACRAAQGTELRAGDILLVRTGWVDMFLAGAVDYKTSGEGLRQPGLGLDTVAFIDDHDIAAVGADNAAVEKMPFDRDVFIGVHVELLVKRGVTLMEHLFLGELSQDGCTEFFLSVGALKVAGAAGSPINPVAIG